MSQPSVSVRRGCHTAVVVVVYADVNVRCCCCPQLLPQLLLLRLATAASVLLLLANAAAAASAASARNCCFDPVKRSCRLFSTPLNGIQCFGYCVAAGRMQQHECRGMPFFHATTNDG